ncbi:FAD-dependent oxidoreductase [Kitasatospora brasiliensis]|uniref:FAD-dependent oxidoreductase n=1 Tax=Kitasatospora brasiliensis TaxID=3058040 RepID=UPI002931B222|nr:FAD-dependent oxidoreductase [Kitasatospora sp. K002]
MHIAVVGAGIAGLTVAWLLDSTHEHEVTVFEAENRIGGHAESVSVPTPHGPVHVDLGAQYVSPAGFPVHGRLLTALGVGAADLADAPVSFTMTAAEGPLTAFPSPASPLIVSPHRPDEREGGRTAVTGPAWASLNTFLGAAADFASADGDWSTPLAELLDPLPVPEEHKRRVIHPLMASISSCSDSQAPELSARAATAFFLALAPPAPDHAPLWANATRGLQDVATRIAAQLNLRRPHRARLRTGCTVTAVRRAGEGFELTDRTGRTHEADRLVLALPAHAAGPLLEPVAGCEEIRRALAAFPYTPVTVAIHRDALHMPADRAHWSTVNLHSHDGWTEACNWYGPVLGPPGSRVFKSWITHREQPADTVATRAFRHLVVTTDAVRAREVLARHQGDGGIHFAGSHLTYIDSQEAAVRSAVTVAKALGGDSPRLRALTPRNP